MCAATIMIDGCTGVRLPSIWRTRSQALPRCIRAPLWSVNERTFFFRACGAGRGCGQACRGNGRCAAGSATQGSNLGGLLLTADRRYLILNAYLRNSGYHEAAWRISPAGPGQRSRPAALHRASQDGRTRCPRLHFPARQPRGSRVPVGVPARRGARSAAVALVGGRHDRAGRADRHCVHDLQLPVGCGPAPGHAGLPQPRASRMEHRHHRRTCRCGELWRPAASPDR